MMTRDRMTAGLDRLLGRRMRRLAEDSEGASLVEFAFMMPILVLVLFMTISLSHMMMIDRKVTMTAQAAADLVAQRQEVKREDIEDLLTAANLMMQPFATDFDISVAHIPFDENTGVPDMTDSAAWRAMINTPSGVDLRIPDDEAEDAAAGNTVTSPSGAVTGALGAAGDSLIMLRMNYRYQSLWLSDFTMLGVTIPATITFSKETYARPRLIRQIAADQAEYLVP